VSAHTPGPWKVHDLYPHVIVTEKDDEENLLHIDYTGDDNGIACAPTSADAKLIAAAPDLLAALKRLSREVGLLSAAVTPNELRAAEKQARAAITKAEGT
jgi:hypothetical protein